MAVTRKNTVLALAATVCVAALAVMAPSGVAQAGTVTTSNVSLPNGDDLVNIVDTTASIDGGGSSLIAGTIGLATSIGSLNTYCTDLFDYIDLGANTYTFNQTTLSTSQQHTTNGSTEVNWTQTQVNLMNALLANGSLQSQTALNSSALQIAIWEVEYGTAASNGTYNLSATNQNFYFTASGSDSNSASAISLAQTFLNDVTGYVSGSSFVNATWNLNASDVVEYLISNPAGTQNLIYVASAPEPSTVAVFGLALIGLWAAKRRKLI